MVGKIILSLKRLLATLALGSVMAMPAFAQQSGTAAVSPPPMPYGAPISFAAAKKAMEAAEAEAMRKNLPVVIAIVDPGGAVVMLHRMDNAQSGSLHVALGKATTAVEFRRPSKAWEEAVARGGAGVRVLSFGVTASAGGLPIVNDGRVAGAIGVSGAPTSAQDAEIAQAGLDAVK